MAIFVTSGDDELAKERLALLLKELRGERTQREFAKHLGTSYTSLQDWEKKIRLPREKNLILIAKLKGWSQDELLRFLFPAKPGNSELLIDPVEQLFQQVQALSVSQKQRLRDYLNLYLSSIHCDQAGDMSFSLSDKQKHNLHLLLRASLKGQNPTDTMAKAGINPELFTDVYLRNDQNRLVDYAALEKFSGLCCRVIEWRGDHPPEIDQSQTYLGNTALLCHDLAENGRVITD